MYSELKNIDKDIIEIEYHKDCLGYLPPPIIEWEFIHEPTWKDRLCEWMADGPEINSYKTSLNLLGDSHIRKVFFGLWKKTIIILLATHFNSMHWISIDINEDPVYFSNRYKLGAQAKSNIIEIFRFCKDILRTGREHHKDDNRKEKPLKDDFSTQKANESVLSHKF